MAIRILAGSVYKFYTTLPYAKRHHGKVVEIIAAGSIVSVCRSEDGFQFAAFNSELSKSEREE